MELTRQKVTVYRRSEFGLGYTKTECTQWGYAVCKYAQYPSAVEVRCVPKRKRKARYFMETYRPSTVILEGHGHPDPDSPWGTPEVTESGCVVKKGRHSGFSEEWNTEFDAKIDSYLAESGAKVLLDLRKHNTYATQTTITDILNKSAA